MRVEAMKPFGMALLAYFDGDTAAELTIRRDDGQEVLVPVSIFFRDPAQFTPLENAAIDRCAGHVLDVGAGTGLHSLVLQRKGHSVTAMDVSTEAVGIMKERGVTDVHLADIFDFHGTRFDTLLMMGHGIGVVETIGGLDRFLAHARALLRENGQLLLDSLDVRKTDDPANLAYHETNRRADRYIGETRIRFEFRDTEGPYCGWLHVDAETLKEHAEAAGWQCEVVHREENGNYLGRLTQQHAVTQERS